MKNSFKPKPEIRHPSTPPLELVGRPSSLELKLFLGLRSSMSTWRYASFTVVQDQLGIRPSK